MLSMRLDPEADPAVRSKLFFDNGGVKGLSCFICLIGLLDLTNKFSTDSFSHPKVKDLIHSMLHIASIHKQCDMSNALDSQIQRVIKQNQDAAAQPISSFGWSTLLKKMAGAIAEEGIDYDTALQLYNSHPSVVSAAAAATWF